MIENSHCTAVNLFNGMNERKTINGNESHVSQANYIIKMC